MKPVLLVGLSGRMLAELAVKAGYPVFTVDYFGDADMPGPHRSLRHNYGWGYSPTALVEAASPVEAEAVVYTASLENHPARVARLGQGRRLLGNPPETLQAVRDPMRLGTVLQQGRFAFPATRLEPPPPDDETSWLCKPRQSGGGHGVRLWKPGLPPGEVIFQQAVPGMVGSALFVANGREAVPVGLTEQLVGRAFLNARGFRYCGNLVPPRLEAGELTRLLAEAEALAGHVTAAFGLRGLNGLDFVWHAGRIWTLEINPRPCASAEVIDRLYDLRLFDAHVRACAGDLPAFDLKAQPGRAGGKGIYFAPETVNVGDTSGWFGQGRRDIPHPGETIRQYRPVCSILVEAATPADAFAALQTAAARLRAELTPAG